MTCHLGIAVTIGDLEQYITLRRGPYRLSARFREALGRKQWPPCMPPEEELRAYGCYRFGEAAMRRSEPSDIAESYPSTVPPQSHLASFWPQPHESVRKGFEQRDVFKLSGYVSDGFWGEWMWHLVIGVMNKRHLEDVKCWVECSCLLEKKRFFLIAVWWIQTWQVIQVKNSYANNISGWRSQACKNMRENAFKQSVGIFVNACGRDQWGMMRFKTAVIKRDSAILRCYFSLSCCLAVSFSIGSLWIEWWPCDIGWPKNDGVDVREVANLKTMDCMDALQWTNIDC